MAFRTIITHVRKARFIYSGLTSEAMAGIAGSVMASVKARTVAGKDTADATAKPLKPGRNGKPGYPERKVKAGLAPIRNWVGPRSRAHRIKTLRAMQVLAANENRAIIGFTNPVSDRIAHLNNRLNKQFGISPLDRSEALAPAVNEALHNAVKTGPKA